VSRLGRGLALGSVTDTVTTAALKGLHQATRAMPARLRYAPTVQHARQIICECERHQHTAPDHATA
jgi:hypothetical protein